MAQPIVLSVLPEEEGVGFYLAAAIEEHTEGSPQVPMYVIDDTVDPADHRQIDRHRDRRAEIAVVGTAVCSYE